MENFLEITKAIDSVWVAVCAALIFQMEGGFALLESGFIRSKNAISIIAKVIVDIIFGGLAFYFIGYAIIQGQSSGWFGVGCGLVTPSIKLTVSNSLFWFMQFGFAVAAISIVSGAVAERIKIWSYAVFVLFFTAFIYPIGAGWVWNSHGWLAVLGFNDFAGSAAVHAVGGWAACAAAIVLGPRIGKYHKNRPTTAIPGHNLPLSIIGAFILWFGWFGFNPGSTLAAVGNWELIGKVVMNTFLASAMGGIATMVYTSVRYHKIDITMVINGILAGLVAITAGCNLVSHEAALIIGLAAGVLVDIGVYTIEKAGIDDPVGAIAVHGVNGIWGTVAVGLFAAEKGLFHSGNFSFLAVQAMGVMLLSIFSFAATFCILTVMKITVGIRINANQEILGIDMSEYGIEAYSTFE